MLRILCFVLFCLPKKERKKAPANDIQHIRGTSLDLAFVLMTFQQLSLDPLCKSLTHPYTG
jgi:hypothetical protein